MIKDDPFRFPSASSTEQELVAQKALRDFVDRETVPIRERLEEDADLQKKGRRL